MALGAGDIVVSSHVFALCLRAEQRHEQGGPPQQPALQPLRLEIASELHSASLAAARDAGGETHWAGVVLLGSFRSVWFVSPPAFQEPSGKVPCRPSGGMGSRWVGQREVFPPIPPGRNEGAGGPDCRPDEPCAGQPWRCDDSTSHRGPHQGQPDSPEWYPPLGALVRAGDLGSCQERCWEKWADAPKRSD